MITFTNLDYTSDFEKMLSDSVVPSIFVFACGYEKRSTFLFSETAKFLSSHSKVEFLCFSFISYKEEGSRQENDRVVAKRGLVPILVPDDNLYLVYQSIDQAIEKYSLHSVKVRLVIDYSSMPRSWYCGIFLHYHTNISLCDLSYWYVLGRFGTIEYPCVGYGDFNTYSGTPRVTQTTEIHVFGLGLDTNRTYGIWSYLDPQYTCCLIGRGQGNEDLVKRVEQENHEILLSARLVNYISFDRFSHLLSDVTDLARDLLDIGDVCFVADGPKPIVLALSIAPKLYNKDGLYTWHVAHTKPSGYKPIDVPPSNIVYGFSCSPRREP